MLSRMLLENFLTMNLTSDSSQGATRKDNCLYLNYHTSSFFYHNAAQN